jgi:hypothetical protein
MGRVRLALSVARIPEKKNSANGYIIAENVDIQLTEMLLLLKW